MTAQIVYIGIGSNLDKPVDQVKQAIQEFGTLKLSERVKSSSLYFSQPMGPGDQPAYVNAVVSIKTKLTPLALLDELQKIETVHGRVRTGLRWGPRTLDLDILLFGQKTINLPRLNVPHPGLHERPFVLYPLSEISPGLTIPARGSLASLIETCSADGLEKIIT